MKGLQDISNAETFRQIITIYRVDKEVEHAPVAVDTGKVLGHSVPEEGKARVKQ